MRHAIPLAMLVLAGGCVQGECLRDSDCAKPLVCTAVTCVEPPFDTDPTTDGSGTDDGLVTGGTDGLDPATTEPATTDPATTDGGDDDAPTSGTTSAGAETGPAMRDTATSDGGTPIDTSSSSGDPTDTTGVSTSSDGGTSTSSGGDDSTTSSSDSTDDGSSSSSTG